MWPRKCTCCGEALLTKKGFPAKRGKICAECKKWQIETVEKYHLDRGIVVEVV